MNLWAYLDQRASAGFILVCLACFLAGAVAYWTGPSPKKKAKASPDGAAWLSPRTCHSFTLINPTNPNGSVVVGPGTKCERCFRTFAEHMKGNLK